MANICLNKALAFAKAVLIPLFLPRFYGEKINIMKTKCFGLVEQIKLGSENVIQVESIETKGRLYIIIQFKSFIKEDHKGM